MLTPWARRREPRVRRYSWLQDYLVRLDGKEAREECYAWLEQGLVRSGDIFGVRGSASDRDPSRADGRFWDRAPDVLKSVGVGLLLFAMVASAIAGAEAWFFFSLVAAWLLFPVLVGLRNTLDAGCSFMLISAGVVVVVELARYGPGSLLP